MTQRVREPVEALRRKTRPTVIRRILCDHPYRSVLFSSRVHPRAPCKFVPSTRNEHRAMIGRFVRCPDRSARGGGSSGTEKSGRVSRVALSAPFMRLLFLPGARNYAQSSERPSFRFPSAFGAESSFSPAAAGLSCFARGETEPWQQDVRAFQAAPRLSARNALPAKTGRRKGPRGEREEGRGP